SNYPNFLSYCRPDSQLESSSSTRNDQNSAAIPLIRAGPTPRFARRLPLPGTSQFNGAALRREDRRRCRSTAFAAHLRPDAYGRLGPFVHTSFTSRAWGPRSETE